MHLKDNALTFEVIPATPKASKKKKPEFRGQFTLSPIPVCAPVLWGPLGQNEIRARAPTTLTE